MTDEQGANEERGARRGAETVIAVGVALALVLGGLALYRSRMQGPAAPLSGPATATPSAVTAAEGGWSEVATLETGLEHPRGIELGVAERVYVVGDGMLHVIAKEGDKVEAELKGAPTCLSFDEPAGRLYVGTRDHVEVYDHCGTPLASWGSLGEKAVITSVSVAGDAVWVADAGNRVVVRYDKSGVERGRVGEKRGAGTGLIVRNSPHLDIAGTDDGEVWVANLGVHEMQKYDSAGEITAKWGRQGQDEEGFSGCCNPADFAMRADGGFVTAEKGGLARVKTYDAAGKYEGLIVGPSAFDTRAMQDAALGLDVAVGANGRVYVLDAPAKVVRVYEKTGGK